LDSVHRYRLFDTGYHEAVGVVHKRIRTVRQDERSAVRALGLLWQGYIYVFGICIHETQFAIFSRFIEVLGRLCEGCVSEGRHEQNGERKVSLARHRPARFVAYAMMRTYEDYFPERVPTNNYPKCNESTGSMLAIGLQPAPGFATSRLPSGAGRIPARRASNALGGAFVGRAASSRDVHHMM